MEKNENLTEEETTKLNKITQEILADDSNIHYFLIPLMLKDIYKKERTIAGHNELLNCIKELKQDSKKLEAYKEALKENISYDYLYSCWQLQANTSGLYVIELLRTYTQLMYDLNQIQDKSTAKVKTLFLQRYIAEKLNTLKDILIVQVNNDLRLKYKHITAEYLKRFDSYLEILALIKLREDTGLLSLYVIRELNSFSSYLLSTGTEKQTIQDYENRFQVEKDLIDETLGIPKGAVKYKDDNNVTFTGFLRNTYTNYDITTDDGKENYAKKMEAVQNKIDELTKLVDEMKDKKGKISLEQIESILSFNKEQQNILAYSIDEQLAELEKVTTPIKPNSYTYITNKVQRNLDKVESLTPIDQDLLPMSLGKQKGDIVLIVGMETMQDALEKLNLTEYDKRIHNACKNLLKDNKEINIESVFDYMTGNKGERPNPTALDDIEKSIDKLRGKIIRLSYGTVRKLKSKLNKGEDIELDFESPLLPLKKLKASYKGKEHTFYRLVGTYEENDYFKFIDSLGQLASVPVLYLSNDGAVRNTSENILLTNYLAEQITLMRSGSLDTNKISYDKIYQICEVEEATGEAESNALRLRKNRIRKNVDLILKEKKKQGLIKHYAEYKEEKGTAHKVAGIEIFTEVKEKQ